MSCLNRSILYSNMIRKIFVSLTIFCGVCVVKPERLETRLKLLEKKIHDDFFSIKESMSQILIIVEKSGINSVSDVPNSLSSLSTKVEHTSDVLMRAFQDEKRWFREQKNTFGQILTQISRSVRANNAHIYSDINAYNRSFDEMNTKLDSLTILADRIMMENRKLQQGNKLISDEVKNTSKAIIQIQEQLMLKDWERQGSSFYFLGHGEVTWYQAKSHCENIGGYLPEIDSKEEHEFLKDRSNTHFSKSSYGIWLGGSDESHEGTWTWVHSGRHIFPSITFWKEGEPNNSGGSENCLHMYKSVDYRWNDVSCTGTMAFICERSGTL